MLLLSGGKHQLVVEVEAVEVEEGVDEDLVVEEVVVFVEGVLREVGEEVVFEVQVAVVEVSGVEGEHREFALWFVLV